MRHSVLHGGCNFSLGFWWLELQFLFVRPKNYLTLKGVKSLKYRRNKLAKPKAKTTRAILTKARPIKSNEAQIHTSGSFHAANNAATIPVDSKIRLTTRVANSTGSARRANKSMEPTSGTSAVCVWACWVSGSSPGVRRLDWSFMELGGYSLQAHPAKRAIDLERTIWGVSKLPNLLRRSPCFARHIMEAKLLASAE